MLDARLQSKYPDCIRASFINFPFFQNMKKVPSKVLWLPKQAKNKNPISPNNQDWVFRLGLQQKGVLGLEVFCRVDYDILILISASDVSSKPQRDEILSERSIQCLRNQSYIPYARHYNPRFVYFLPHFSVRFIIKSG